MEQRLPSIECDRGILYQALHRHLYFAPQELEEHSVGDLGVPDATCNNHSGSRLHRSSTMHTSRGTMDTKYQGTLYLAKRTSDSILRAIRVCDLDRFIFDRLADGYFMEYQDKPKQENWHLRSDEPWLDGNDCQRLEERLHSQFDRV